jgi:hypothetical protein
MLMVDLRHAMNHHRDIARYKIAQPWPTDPRLEFAIAAAIFLPAPSTSLEVLFSVTKLRLQRRTYRRSPPQMDGTFPTTQLMLAE